MCLFLAAQIIELHQKLKPLEDEILELKDTNAENVAGKDQDAAFSVICQNVVEYVT